MSQRGLMPSDMVAWNDRKKAYNYRLSCLKPARLANRIQILIYVAISEVKTIVLVEKSRQAYQCLKLMRIESW